MAEKVRISLLGTEGVSVLEAALQKMEEAAEIKALEEEKVKLAPARRKAFAEDLVRGLNGRADSCGNFKASSGDYLSQTILLHCPSVSDYLPQEYSVEIDFPRQTIAFSPTVKSFEVDFKAESKLDKLLEIANDYAHTAEDFQIVDDFLREYSRSQGFVYSSPFRCDSPGQLSLLEMELLAKSPVESSDKTAKIPPDHDYFKYLKDAEEKFMDVLGKAPLGYNIAFNPTLEQGRLLFNGVVHKRELSKIDDFPALLNYSVTLDYFGKRASLEVSPTDFEVDVSELPAEKIEELKEDLETVMEGTKAVDKLLAEHAEENKFEYNSLFPDVSEKKAAD